MELISDFPFLELTFLDTQIRSEIRSHKIDFVRFEAVLHNASKVGNYISYYKSVYLVLYVQYVNVRVYSSQYTGVYSGSESACRSETEFISW